MLLTEELRNAIFNHKEPTCPIVGKVALFVLREKSKSRISLNVRINVVGI